MNKALLVFFGAAISLPSAFASPSPALIIDHAKIVSIYDGDTFTIELPYPDPFRMMPVRVYGIDAPEMKSKKACERLKALEAKTLISSQILNAKNVTLKNVKRDKYFRLLAQVYADGILVSDLLLEKKLAYPYFGATKKMINWCKL